MLKGTTTASAIAKTVRDLSLRRADFVLDQGHMFMNDNTAIHLYGESGAEKFVMGNEVFHRGMSEKLAIPAKYYERMKAEQPSLLAANVNRWLSQEPRKARMIRTYTRPGGGDQFYTGRALLSDRYRWRDDEELMLATLPLLEDRGFTIRSSEITDTRFYLQVSSPRIQGEVRKGDVVEMGLAFRNSEVGYGATQVDALLWRLWCQNGATHIEKEPLFRERHTGGQLDQGVYTETTRRYQGATFVSEMRDVLNAATSPGRFAEILGRLQSTAKVQVPKPLKAIERVGSALGLTQEEQDAAYAKLIGEGESTQWTLANAITGIAHDATDYDRAVQIEGFGGRVLTMTPRQVEALSE